MKRARVSGIGFVGLALLLAVGAAAWACTPSAYLYPVSPSRGPAGSEVTIRGGQFGNGPVELRWGSEHGRLLSTTLGPDFTTKVSVPDRAKGVHYVVAVVRDPSDQSRILARRAEAFEITSGSGSGGQDGAGSLWSEARQPSPESNRFPTIAFATLGLGVAATGAGLFAVVVVMRRRRAEAP